MKSQNETFQNNPLTLFVKAKNIFKTLDFKILSVESGCPNVT